MALTEPLLITPMINWETGLEETRAYETWIFSSDDESEQRAAKRDVPNRRLSYTVTPEDRESNIIEALIYGGQALICWVPYWRGVRHLNSDTAIGANDIPCTTGGAGFVVGQGAMIFSSPYNYEVAIIDSITSGAVVPVDLLTKAWLGSGRRKHRVVPLLKGRLASEIELNYLERGAKNVPLVFDLIV